MADDQKVVYGVFTGDGFECEFIDAVFATQLEADTHAELLKTNIGNPKYHVYSMSPEHIVVRALEIGKRLT